MKDSAGKYRRDDFVGNIFVFRHFVTSKAEVNFNDGHEAFERFKDSDSLTGSGTRIVVFPAD